MVPKLDRFLKEISGHTTPRLAGVSTKDPPQDGAPLLLSLACLQEDGAGLTDRTRVRSAERAISCRRPQRRHTRPMSAPSRDTVHS